MKKIEQEDILIFFKNERAWNIPPHHQLVRTHPTGHLILNTPLAIQYAPYNDVGTQAVDRDCLVVPGI